MILGALKRYLLMIRAILEVTSNRVTVRDANDIVCTVSIERTPRRKFLTQSTKRTTLATGFMLAYPVNAHGRYM